MQLLRQEFKFYISNEQIMFLRHSLNKFMKLDENTNKDKNNYTITSLYFDSPNNDAFNEKVDGVYAREKFRIRKYSESDIIKFESKKKIENVIYKTSFILDEETVKNLSKNNMQLLTSGKSNFLDKSFAIIKSNGLRAKNIVEYDREAYYLPYGNIRITFDTNLRTYNSNNDFFDKKKPYTSIFHHKINILEIKHSLPLPEHLKIILRKITANRCAISKFVLSDKYTNFSPYQDNIVEPS